MRVHYNSPLLTHPSVVQYAFEAFRTFYQDLRLAMINPDEQFADSSYIPRRTRDDQEWHGLGRYRNTKGDHQAYHHFAIFPVVHVTFISDVAGPIQSARYRFNPNMSPKYHVILSCGESRKKGIGSGDEPTLYYGPWINRHRGIIQGFFFPPDYQNAAQPDLSQGKPRPHAFLEIDLKFPEGLKVVLPFQSMEAGGNHTENYNFTMTCQEATIHYKQPQFRFGNEKDYQSKIDIVTTSCEMTSDLMDFEKPFLVANHFQVKFQSNPSSTRNFAEMSQMGCALQHSTTWNGTVDWRFSLDFDGIRLFIVNRYFSLFKFLSQDWTAENVPPDLAYFIPIRYFFDIRFGKFELLFNVNERNLTTELNDLETNGEISRRNRILKFEQRITYWEELG